MATVVTLEHKYTITIPTPQDEGLVQLLRGKAYEYRRMDPRLLYSDASGRGILNRLPRRTDVPRGPVPLTMLYDSKNVIQAMLEADRDEYLARKDIQMTAGRLPSPRRIPSPTIVKMPTQPVVRPASPRGTVVIPAPTVPRQTVIVPGVTVPRPTVVIPAPTVPRPTVVIPAPTVVRPTVPRPTIPVPTMPRVPSPPRATTVIVPTVRIPGAGIPKPANPRPIIALTPATDAQFENLKRMFAALRHPEDQGNRGLMDYLRSRLPFYEGGVLDQAILRGLETESLRRENEAVQGGADRQAIRYVMLIDTLLEDDRLNYLAGRV